MVKISDIAKSLGVSIGTVDRALHGRPRIDPATRERVLEAARAMGYQVNLAASVLAMKRRFRISINLPDETKDFYDEVRAGIKAEYQAYAKTAVVLEYRSFPRLGIGEAEAFEEACQSKVDGIISVFSHPAQMKSRLQVAHQSGIQVVAVVTGAPAAEQIPSVSIDPRMSGSLAAGILGGVLKHKGKVAIETGDLRAWEHKEKIKAFTKALHQTYPFLEVLPVTETHEEQEEARKKTIVLLDRHKDLVGYYVSTVNSMPVISALKSRNLLGKVVLITTDVFPQLIPYLRSGDITATLHQRPLIQGELALRTMYRILREGANSRGSVMLQPHVVMRTNLEYFLQEIKQDTGTLPATVI
jgi:LacI family transcriptional regulator, galactose operon repressor